jgi:hypothetical protein
LQELLNIHLLILFGCLSEFAWKERLSLHHSLEVEVIQDFYPNAHIFSSLLHFPFAPLDRTHHLILQTHDSTTHRGPIDNELTQGHHKVCENDNASRRKPKKRGQTRATRSNLNKLKENKQQAVTLRSNESTLQRQAPEALRPMSTPSAKQRAPTEPTSQSRPRTSCSNPCFRLTSHFVFVRTR